MDKPKRKSDKRFEQLNELTDKVCPTLPNCQYVTVVLVCYRHGRANGFFRVSLARLSSSTRIKHRQLQYILKELQLMGVITLVQAHQGPIPAVYRFTFAPARPIAIDSNWPPSMINRILRVNRTFTNSAQRCTKPPMNIVHGSAP